MSESSNLGVDTLDAISKQLQQAQTVGADGKQATGLDMGSLLGDISVTVITIDIIAGIIGTYYFMYGKRKSDITMMVSGVLLCVFPYFVTNVYGVLICCLILISAPFVADKFF